MTTRPAPAGTAAGFTLVEALVSLVVLMVGILGLAQLYGFSARASDSSFRQTLVHTQAVDMAERMWFDLTNPLSQLDAWRADHQGSLPGWQGSVTSVPGDPDLYEIKVQWVNASGPTEFSYFLRLPKVTGGGGS